MEAAHDLQALEGFLRPVFFPDGHQAGHFGFGQKKLFPSPFGQGQVGDFVGEGEVEGRDGDSFFLSFGHGVLL